MYNNKKIFILGMSKSGYEVAKLLANTNEILITDMKDQDEKNIKELETLNVKFVKSEDPIELLDSSYNILIKNPGINMQHTIVQKALKLNIPIVNEMEVAYHYLPANITIIGVTGSNGKTTTTTIIYEILKAMNKNVILGGNIGTPLSKLISEIKENDILLLEISDHQLLNMQDFKTNISVLTNICPTHLDFHESYDAYKKTKIKIFNHHTNKDLAIINYNDLESMLETSQIASKKEYYTDKECYIKDNAIYFLNNKIIDIDKIVLRGNHNYQNIMAAILVVKEFGLDINAIKKVLTSFSGVEHRLEFVKEKNGTKYYNDSKSTNPTSTITALKSFNDPIILILGGMERKQDFNELTPYITNVKYILAIGECRDRVEEYANNNSINCIKRETLKEALDEIKNIAQPKDIVLLSPASASWDQYDKFETRGNEFKELI